MRDIAMGVRSVKRETTKRAHAEKRYRALLEAMAALVFLHRKGTLIYVNPAALGVLGLGSCAEVVGRTLQDLIHPDDRDSLGAQSEALTGRRLRLLRNDGTVRVVESISIPILFEGAITTASIATDVTECAEAKEKLLLADRLAAIGTLAAGAAHEINNPLTYATINLEHVMRQLRIAAAEDRPIGGASDGGAQLDRLLVALAQALQGMMRIRDIVRSLGTFSQGTVESKTLVDVRSIVESSIQLALHEIAQRARLVRMLGAVPPVEANEARLAQVFLNLIVNAAQAIPEGNVNAHEVRVATRTNDGGGAVIEVGDTGSGIAPEGLARVFDPFFTSKAPGAGGGLGLSMSLGTIKSLGGDIEVASEPERGTVFRVVLPPAKGWQTTHSAPASESVGVERRRMLVVDGDQYVGEALERSLSDLADVEATTDGRAALDRLGSGQRWDVILCDLEMPEMSGTDLYREVLRVAPDAAACIVFMTAGAFTPKARAFLEGVHNLCLEKPLDIGNLRSLIARAGSLGAAGPR
jgi:PAS domain S-box-containing protein